ncbi:MAG TPA: hypothetical protein DDY20_10390 [Desulfobulbaceae bacterium]|nr:hypothetical protein [Desulfobulbaceae bacterium]
MELRTSLVYPAISIKGFGGLMQGMDGGWISHGLASISAAAKASGFAIDLIDLRALRGWDHFRQVLQERSPRVLGFTMMSSDAENVRTASAMAKDLDPAVITLAGGPHVSMAPDDAALFPHLDYLVIGEGEELFPRLLAGFARGERPGERMLRGQRPQLDLLPFSDRQLFLDEWRRCGFVVDSPEVPFLPELPPPFATIIAGRGCPFHCSFCKPGEDLLFGRAMRTRSPENVVAELAGLAERFRLRSFLFHDDCLFHDRAWLQRFAECYRQAGLTMRFFCQSRADLLVRNQDLLPELRAIGLRGLFIGFESGSQRILDFLRKGTTVRENLEAARLCKRNKLAIWANYMLGIPTETRGEAQATVEMIRTIDPDYFSPAFFTPQPGTELGRYVEEHGLGLQKGYEGMRRNPDAPKIRGIDYDFLKKALAESRRRRPGNMIRRGVSRFSVRVQRKLMRLWPFQAPLSNR